MTTVYIIHSEINPMMRYAINGQSEWNEKSEAITACKQVIETTGGNWAVGLITHDYTDVSQLSQWRQEHE
jgi:hypothetical protein